MIRQKVRVMRVNQIRERICIPVHLLPRMALGCSCAGALTGKTKSRFATTSESGGPN